MGSCRSNRAQNAEARLRGLSTAEGIEMFMPLILAAPLARVQIAERASCALPRAPKRSHNSSLNIERGRHGGTMHLRERALPHDERTYVRSLLSLPLVPERNGRLLRPQCAHRS